MIHAVVVVDTIMDIITPVSRKRPGTALRDTRKNAAAVITAAKRKKRRAITAMRITTMKEGLAGAAGNTGTTQTIITGEGPVGAAGNTGITHMTTMKTETHMLRGAGT